MVDSYKCLQLVTLQCWKDIWRFSSTVHQHHCLGIKVCQHWPTLIHNNVASQTCIRIMVLIITCKDTSWWPQVNGCCVDLCPHENIRWPVPQCHYLQEKEDWSCCCLLVVTWLTSAEKILTGIPNARANPKSASFSSPFYNWNKKKTKIVPIPGVEPGPPGWKPGILTARPYGTTR